MSSDQTFSFQKQDEWIAAAVREITSELPQDDVFALALGGGSTPAKIYEALAQQNLSWAKAHIFQTDERFVRAESADSNQKLIHEHFWDLFPTEKPQLHLFDTSGKLSWEEAANAYDIELQSFQQPFDACILGIGPDGHIASLFPNGPELEENEQLATTSETNRFSVWKRLTLTFPVILKSKKLIVLVKGKEKKAVVEELEHGPKAWRDFPAKRLLEHPDLHIFFCDE